MIASTIVLALAAVANAHTGAFADGMYCRGGPDLTIDNKNTNAVVNPLYQLAQEDWWFQHDRKCDLAPPADGLFLDLPVGKSFTVQLAHNRAQTTLSTPESKLTKWTDALEHPDDYSAALGQECVSNGALHTVNQNTAAGTAFAISYQSDLSKVTLDNLVVFTTLQHTPWYRNATYEVPADLPACPEGGCHCAWLWVPEGCGQPNMYMQGFKCQVTGATSTVPLATPKAPVYCADDPSKCVKGAKQMIAWQQASGSNMPVVQGQSPAYSTKCGWTSGAQNDIFASSPAQSSAVASSAAPVASSAAPVASSSAPAVSSAPLIAVPTKPAPGEPIATSVVATTPVSAATSTVAVPSLSTPLVATGSVDPITVSAPTTLVTLTRAPSSTPVATVVPAPSATVWVDPDYCSSNAPSRRRSYY